MQFPLSLWDIGLLITITFIMLLATAEFVSPYYGQINLLIDKKKLREVTLIMGILFLITVAIRIINIITA